MSSPKRETFFSIPHTHWEGAVFKTREEYLEMGLSNILRALRLLREHANYRFVLDQSCYVKPFLERYPEERASFQGFVDQGRLAIVGGTLVMPDVNMPGGESFVRQMMIGKGFFARELGVEVTAGWLLDTFGHNAQIPQLLTRAGFGSFWFNRGVPGWETPAEFLWEGIDGSRILAFWLPHSYAVTYGSPQDLPGFAKFMRERFDLLSPFARGPERVGLAGADVCEPEPHVPALADQFNRGDAPFVIRLAVPSEYEEIVKRRTEMEVLRCELNPIFQGTYSSRIELKQRTRELEGLLLSAEKLGALLTRLGTSVDDQILWTAWEPMLFNQAHDLMSGVMTDHVYRDTLASYDFSRRIGVQEVADRLQRYAVHVQTQGKGEEIPVVIFNPLGWPRTEVTTVEAGFGRPGVRGLRLLDPEGSEVPIQILSSERISGGELLRAKIAFLAREVPAMGHAVYRLVGLSEAAPEAPQDRSAVLENERFHLELDPGSGAMTRLVSRPQNWEVLSAPGNVVVQEPDRGDLWELYRSLDGGSRIAMSERHPIPDPGQAVFSNSRGGAEHSLIRGPILSELKVVRDFGASGRFSTRVRVCPGMRRIECHTTILNRERFVRYRALFPSSLRAGACVHEIPFGALSRPEGIEFPAQNWLDWGDDRRGLALLNRGIPGNGVLDGTLCLSLLRSTRIVAYGFGGGYEPGMSSDSGFELDEERTFDYALVPHEGDWRQAGLTREGLEFNHPLLTLTTTQHRGPLPARWGLLDASPESLVISALKRGPDNRLVLRAYEATGRPAPGASIQFSTGIHSAFEADLLERPGSPMEVDRGAIRFDLGPFEIKTILFD